MKLRTRIAPTPSGYLHLGNAWSFVLTWLAARSQGGKIHLRIDDLDAARFRDEYLEDIFETLHWLGLDWDSGPRDAVEFKAVHSQRLKLAHYQEALNSERLRPSLYACSCSREQLHACTCRDRGTVLNEQGHALRYRSSNSMGDFVVRQKNGEPSYQLASVVDDENLRINFVVRGLDLVPSTEVQLSLARTLGLENFPRAQFWHHALVLDDAGEKLSKSVVGRGVPSDAPTIASLHVMRKKFADPSPLYRFFASHMGVVPDGIQSVRDVISGFRMEKVATMPLRLSDFLRESGG